MWSNRGNSTNTARSNSLMPQPVSGVPSPNKLERTPLATILRNLRPGRQETVA